MGSTKEDMATLHGKPLRTFNNFRLPGLLTFACAKPPGSPPSQPLYQTYADLTFLKLQGDHITLL